MIVRVALVLAALARIASAQCDPYTQRTEVPIPKALQLASTCGNGRIDVYASECTKIESGGCGLQTHSSVECSKPTEVCDRGNLNGRTCAGEGYAGGTLACAPSCLDLIFDRCTLCMPGSTCQERTVVAREWEDVSLIAQGETVRAFWYDRTHYYFAEVDAKGALVNRQTLSDMGSTRLVPVQVGDSALTIVGPSDHPQLSVVDVHGKATLTPLAGQSGMLFMPLVPAVDKPLGVVIVGSYMGAHVTVVDARGVAQPPAPLYARNIYRRVALLPLAAGAHHVQWSNYEGDVTSEAGDLLYVMFDYHHYIGVLHAGVATFPFTKQPQHVAGTTDNTPEPPEILIDGKVVASMSATEDAVLGSKYPAPARPALLHVFGDIAYHGDVAYARTSKLEIQATRLRHGDEDDSKGTLAVSVKRR